MTGQIRTFTRTFYPTSSQQSVGEAFVTFIQYFDNHPSFQRIASNFGISGQGFGNTFLFSGSVGEEAFAIYRAVSSSIQYDVSFYWSYNFYSLNRWTDPSINYGLGMQLAWHSSSQPWSGTSTNTGADVFTTNNKPWKSGSVVLPRINGSGGATVTNKNGVLKIIDSSLTTNNLWQLTIIGDDDTTHAFFQNASENGQGSAQKFITFGKYTPYTSSYTLPLVAYSVETFDSTTAIGSTSDGDVSSTANGGLSYTTSSDCRSFKINFPIYAPERTPRVATNLLNETNKRAYIYPVSLTTYEAGHYNLVGVLSGVYVSSQNAFGNIQDVSRSFVTIKMPSLNINNLCIVLPFSGSADFFLRGAFE